MFSKDTPPSAGIIQAAPSGRLGVHRLARRLREYISLIRAVCDAPDPSNPEYIMRQRELVKKLSDEHILSDDPEQAAQEYIQNGDAELYAKGARAKQNIKETITFKKGNGKK